MEKRWQWLKAFIKYVFSQFGQKHASAMAAELTLNTMLALVPLMTVAVSLMAVFPAFEGLNNQVQELIFKNFLPETGFAVQEHLNEYVAKSKNLSAIGFAFLMITALLLMRSIDKAINTLWETNNKRYGVSKWLAYWAMLTMSPILIAGSLAATSYFAALPLVAGFGSLLTIGLPLVLIILAFTVLYMITPFSRVEFKKAFISAVITAILFEVAKYGFALFVAKFSTYEVIYGAITAIPLFFLWVSLSWLIVLLGAVICYALHRFEMQREKSEHEFISVIKILQFFAIAQKGESVASYEQVRANFPYLHRQTLHNYLGQLVSLGFLVKIDEEEYCLKVNGKDLTVLDIYRRGNWRLPNNNQVLEAKKNNGFSQLIENANLDLDKVLAVALLESNIENSNT